MTRKCIVVAKPAVSTLTSLDSSFQVMIKGSTEAGDLLKSHCLSLWPWEEEGRAKRWNFENQNQCYFSQYSYYNYVAPPIFKEPEKYVLCARKVRKLVISEY